MKRNEELLIYEIGASGFDTEFHICKFSFVST